MFNTKNGLVKIGRSINPSHREKTLQGEDPKTFILNAWKADISIEKKLQQRFDDRRIRGEWFDLTIKNILEIKDFMDTAAGYNSI